MNKADREGADATMRDLELMIALGTESMLAIGKQRGHVVHGGAKVDVIPEVAKGESERSWTPSIHKVVATRNEGVGDVVAALDLHREWLGTTVEGRARRHARLADELREALRETLIEAATQALGPEIDAAVVAVEARETDPYSATQNLARQFHDKMV